ncbi:hypothetical protein [Marinibacterium profundimaris]|uniref:Uncharacterized protein n=1 Tax=Marinibacterium profundimaris TaxID=1679460 RepID=A0A225NHR5_9RHOB|nr:hypothetical protein [Marinibacterium profundimaris]OWU72982.1 hypothetical protein ATO3_15010 [Marinibacterium profundimaris]
MGKYNRNFELGLQDMELIENALQQAKKDLSLKRLRLLAQEMDEATRAAELDDIQTELTETHELLGKLHNQKVFWRPRKDTPYVSG